VRAQDDRVDNPIEQAGYLKLGEAHLYTVLHRVANPIARVLLVGPFASERHFSYTPWVRWARFLANQQIEALRFDYRGVGESTGIFEDMTFSDWGEDVEYLSKWLVTQSPHVPLVLHGLELGALLANKIFETGVGDGLLLWSAPNNANEVLRSTLRRHVAVEHLSMEVSERKPVSEYARQLEAERPLEVDGYQWSGRLWRESFSLELKVSEGDKVRAVGECERPVRLIKLDKREAPLAKGSALGFVSVINPDLSGLFADNFDWIAKVAANSKVMLQ
jgi:hypothetical protein